MCAMMPMLRVLLSGTCLGIAVFPDFYVITDVLSLFSTLAGPRPRSLALGGSRLVRAAGARQPHRSCYRPTDRRQLEAGGWKL
jgi:hypothetical protein